MPNPIRFAQLSFWFSHARGICAAAQKHPHINLVAIWDADPKRGRKAAEQFGVEFIPDLDDLLAALVTDHSKITEELIDRRNDAATRPGAMEKFKEFGISPALRTTTYFRLVLTNKF